MVQPEKPSMPIAVRRDKARLRRCLPLVVLLAGVAAMAGEQAPPKRVEPVSEAVTWRRTDNGWEQPHWLKPKLEPRPVPFHPLCVALLEALFAAMALVGVEKRVCRANAAPHVPDGRFQAQ